jgi:protein-arginine kinase activator protein McsA
MDDTRSKLAELNEDLKDILGRPCFMCARVAQLLAKAGKYDIRPKAEDEQAAMIHWTLMLYLEHGSKWRDEANRLVKEMFEQIQRCPKCNGTLSELGLCDNCVNAGGEPS